MADKVPEADEAEKRPQFGTRYLTDTKNVFEHNAWDNVVWDEEQEEEAKRKTEEQLAHPASQEDKERFNCEADQFWDKFYGIHENRFFKDRHWLFTEFPELAPEYYLSKEELAKLSSLGAGGNTENAIKEHEEETPQTEVFPGQSATFRIFEVGCGVGNTVYPVLKANNDPNLMVYCCDFSSTAIDLVKENPDYKCGRCTAFVCDISDPDSTVPFPEASLDVIILIFVLSAIHPDRFQAVMNRLAGFLKPGGILLFRDYGRYDMAQLRFKKGRCLSENFYARGDGTRVYFFTQDELRTLMTNAGLEERQNLIDRRLQVNRGRQLKMYRVWIQCKYVKPDHRQASTVKCADIEKIEHEMKEQNIVEKR